MVEVELWDGTKATPKPIARLEISEKGVEVLAGAGKVRVESIPIGTIGGGTSRQYSIYITNLSMDISDEFHTAAEV